MLGVDTYKIDLRIQPETISETVRYVLGEDFFAQLDESEIRNGDLCADVLVEGRMGVYRFDIKIQGTVEILCDRCLELMTQPVETTYTLKVRLGETYDETDDMLVLPENDGIFDLGWTMYEIIALSVPIMHVHPEGTCNAEMEARLNELRTFDTDE